MTTETLETTAAPPEEANLAPAPDTQTESTTAVDAAVAPEAEEAVASKPDALQVEVTPEAPKYMTTEEAERFFEERAERVRADEREKEQNRRRTQAAREAAAKRESEMRAEAIDVARATLGLTPEYATDEAIDKAISRAARKQAEVLTAGSLDTVDQAWDYLTAPAYGKQVDMDDGFESAAKRLGPKIQHLVDTIRPAIEAAARKGYIAEADLPKLKETWAAEQAANGRQGKEELVRVDGTPASSVMSWDRYMALSDTEKLAMSSADRTAIMAADRKARLGQ